MSNIEGPTFDPDKLPSDATIKLGNDLEFELLERGISLHEIAQTHEQIKEAKRIAGIFDEEVRQPFLAQYGVEEESELPGEAYVEFQFKRAEWWRERRGGVYGENGEIVSE